MITHIPATQPSHLVLSVRSAIDMTSWKWQSRPHFWVSDWLRAVVCYYQWCHGILADPPHVRCLSGCLRAETRGFSWRIWPWHLGHVALLLQEKKNHIRLFAGKAPNSIRGEWGHREWFHMLCKCLEIWYLILAGSSAVLSQDIKTILCPDKWQPSAGWGSCVLLASSSPAWKWLSSGGCYELRNNIGYMNGEWLDKN